MMINWCWVLKCVIADTGAGGVKEVAHGKGMEKHTAFVLCTKLSWVSGVLEEQFHQEDILQPNGCERDKRASEGPSNSNSVCLNILDPRGRRICGLKGSQLGVAREA